MIFLLRFTWVEMCITNAPDLKNRLPNNDNSLSDVMKTVELWVILCKQQDPLCCKPAVI